LSRSEEMIQRLQPFMRRSAVYQSIFDAEAIQFDARDAAISDLQLQLSIDTATWALPIYEAELGIPTDPTKPYSERRSVIKAKMRGTGKVDQALLKLVAASWTGGGIDVQFGSSTITITFNDIVGIPENVEAFKLSMEEITPAHLAVVYVFLYNTWSQAKTKTWGQMKSFTWGQVLSSKIFE